ncbi:MAG TPA: hypothetical protein ENJ32_03865 [Crenotrichaceae bacterium]|nr:hypothetical protein [Crenotrichaceae bacterium]
MITHLTKLWIAQFATVSMGVLFALTALASNALIQPFPKGSRQQILDTYHDQPVMLVLWSVACSSCLKELELISETLQTSPDLNIVFVSTNAWTEFSESSDVMEKHGLLHSDAWAFSDSDIQAQRYEIDPKWYGEVPRTYFYHSTHHRTGLSGKLHESHLNKWLATHRLPSSTPFITVPTSTKLY